MPWGIAAAAVVGAYSAHEQSQAGKDAAGAQRDAADAATAEQRRQYDLSRQDNQPFLDAGYGALDREEAYLSGDMSGFMDSAQYQAALRGGTQAINRAAIGNLSGGGTAADLLSFGQDNATRFGDNYWAKLAGQAGQGQGAVNNLGALGANTASNIGGYLQDAGNARASSYANSANAWGNYANQLGSLAGQYFKYNSPGVG